MRQITGKFKTGIRHEWKACQHQRSNDKSDAMTYISDVRFSATMAFVGIHSSQCALCEPLLYCHASLIVYAALHPYFSYSLPLSMCLTL